MPKVDQETLTAFGIAVRNAKDRKGWTLDELSTELGQGNSKSFLSRIQNGKSDISARTAARLIDKLGLEDSWFDAFATSETSEDEEITPTDARADQLLEAAEESGAYSRLEAAGISEITIIELAQKASSEVEDVSQAWAQLQELTDVAVRVQEEGRTKSNHPDFIDTVLARAADLAAKGDYATAGDELDAALEEEREASTARQQKLLTRAIDMARLDGNAQRAARIIVSLEDLNAGGTASLGSLRATQDEYDVRGKNKGILLDQRIAIAIAEAILPRATTSEERVTLLDDLGIALAHLGERESGTQRLEQAVTAYENALKEWTREKVPLQWATTQNNLGTALQRLGERESGTQRLEQAVTAYENALKEWTKEKVPLQWATIQNNLGDALRSLGDRESGIQRLEEAVTAFENALKELTREKLPMQWASTQNNLGNALSSLGERESGTQRLEQAVTAYENALKEWTREKVPLDWATTQNNLGNALRDLGERESGTQRLEQAVTAYENALKEWTREKVPLDWAGTQMNIAGVYFAFFKKTSDAGHLATARGHMADALEVFEAAGATYYIDAAKKNIELIDSLDPAKG